MTRVATEQNPDFAGLERGYRAALAADPSSANWWGLNLLAKGRFSEAEAEIRQAQLLDPLSLHIGANIGAVYYCRRRYQDTVDRERRILDLDPHLSSPASTGPRIRRTQSLSGGRSHPRKPAQDRPQRRRVGRLRACLRGLLQAVPNAG